MRLLRVVPLAAALLAIPVSAQSLPKRDPQALAVLQQSFAAMGGGIPNDVVAVGSVSIAAGASTDAGTVRIRVRGFDQSVEELQMPQGTLKRTYSRGRAADHEGKRLSFEAALSSQSVAFPSQIIAQALSDAETSFEYVGLETSADGVQAHHVRFWRTFATSEKLRPLSPLSTKDLYIDAATSLPARLAYEQRDSHGPGAVVFHVDVVYSDYRTVGGLVFPFRGERFLNGTSWIVTDLKAISLNTGLSDLDFKVR